MIDCNGLKQTRSQQDEVCDLCGFYEAYCINMSKVEKCRYRKPPNSVLRKGNPVFYTRNQDADSEELSSHLIKLARKSGQLNLSGRGIASGTASFSLILICKLQ